VTLIDFPQMVSTSHPNAAELFDRDVRCLLTYFRRRHGFVPAEFPTFASLPPKTSSLDVRVEASGFFTARQARDFEALMADRDREEEEGEEEGEEGEEGEDDDGEEDEERAEGEGEGGGEGARAGGGAAAGGAAGGGAAEEATPAFYAVAPEALEPDAVCDSADAAGEWQLGAADGDGGGGGGGEGAAARPGGAGGEGGGEGEDDGDTGGGEEEEEAEEDDEDEAEDVGELDGGLEARRREAIDEAALAKLRPPEGVRTRPGGRRIKPRGGEAYLRGGGQRGEGRGGGGGGGGGGGAESAAGDDARSLASGAGRSVRSASSSATTAEDVRLRVKTSLRASRERKERTGIVGRAMSANDNKNGKAIKLASYAKEHVDAERGNAEAFW
jgi:RIO kinase 2